MRREDLPDEKDQAHARRAEQSRAIRPNRAKRLTRVDEKTTLDQKELIGELKFLLAAEVQDAEIQGRWLKVVSALGLSLDHYLDVVTVVQEGKWQTKKNPRLYLYDSAKAHYNRIERTHCVVSTRGAHSLSRAGLKPGKALSVDGSPAEITTSERTHGKTVPYKKCVDRIPPDLIRIVRPTADWKALIDQHNAESGPDAAYIHVPSEIKEIDWKKVGRRSSLDLWEQKALTCKVLGFSRDAAIESQPPGSSRRAMQAAWKRMDRSGWDSLAEVVNPAPNRL